MRALGLLVALAALLGATAPPAGAMDPDWVFYTSDKHHYTSPWYAGAHRIMVLFGCTEAPYYDHDTRCPGDEGFHHGLDIAIPCGTKLYAGKRAKVVDNASLGSAYGENPVLLRNRKLGWDLVIGHTRKVFVEPGDRCTAATCSHACQTAARPTAATCTSSSGPWRAASTRPSGRGRSSRWSRDEGSAVTAQEKPQQERVARHFFDAGGRLHTIPSKHAKLLVVLDRLAQEFEPGQTYRVGGERGAQAVPPRLRGAPPLPGRERLPHPR